MKRSVWFASMACVLVLGSSAYVARAADDAATDASKSETTEKRPGRKSADRLIKPYSQLTDLTDEQKSKIIAIHKDEVAEEKKLRDKETDDINAVLTDDQKKELTTLGEKTKVETKAEKTEEKAKAYREKADKLGRSTTQPSDQ